MTRGQHSRFVTIDVETVVADRCDHVEGLLIIADNEWVCFCRRCKCRVECDLKIGCLTVLLGKFTVVGGRRGGGVLDRGILGIQTLDMSDFVNDVGVLSHIHVHLGLINCRDMTVRIGVEWGMGVHQGHGAQQPGLPRQQSFLVCLMKGRPRMVLTVTLGSTATMKVHGGRDDSILSEKLIRITPETSSF
jgi:hypothetical protein